MKNSFEEEATLYLHYLTKPFILIQEVVTTPKGIAFAIPTLGTISLLSTQRLAFGFLVIACLLDFITGVIASFIEKIKRRKENTKSKTSSLKSSKNYKKLIEDKEDNYIY